jgi:hypothetical protein
MKKRLTNCARCHAKIERPEDHRCHNCEAIGGDEPKLAWTDVNADAKSLRQGLATKYRQKRQMRSARRRTSSAGRRAQDHGMMRSNGHSRVCVALVLLALVACSGGSQSNEREDFVNRLVSAEAATRAQAECIADGMESAGTDMKVWADEDLSASQVEQSLRITLECLGGASVSDCFVKSLVEILGSERLESGTALIRASKDMSVEEREQLVASGFECQGVPPKVARCVVDGMVDHFGRRLFESERLDLAPKQQWDLQNIQEACTMLRQLPSGNQRHDYQLGTRTTAFERTI